jgi:prepilin-type N-terminal cleavage/methylation domain-containing protein
MILSKAIRSVHKDQRGLTLLELLITIALTAIVTTAITMAIGQIFTGSTRSSNHMAVVREVQEAGYWVSLYTYMANNMEITGYSGFPLTLHWIDFALDEEHDVVFSLDSSGLRGSYYVDDVFDEEKTGKIPVFEFVDPDGTNLKFGGGSAFSLPDINDAFNITGGVAPDDGRIIIREGSIAVTLTGSATYTPATGEWTTTDTGDIIQVTATSSGTRGTWTSETQVAIAYITVDTGTTSATLSDARVLIFTVTATLGTGGQESSESRVYEIVPKPVS